MSAKSHAQEGLYAACGPRRGREAYPAVFMRYGNVTHLLGMLDSPNYDGPALCGRKTATPWSLWFGTGSEREYDQARAMPLCQDCAKRTTPTVSPFTITATWPEPTS